MSLVVFLTLSVRKYHDVRIVDVMVKESFIRKFVADMLACANKSVANQVLFNEIKE